MKILSAALASMLSLASGCRRHDDAARPPPPPPPDAGFLPSWITLPPEGAPFAAGAGVIAGGLRALDRRVAPPPFAASPLVAAAALTPTRWRFASVDGTLYESGEFLGPLRPVGALPGRVREPVGAAQRWGRGALALVDERGDCWIDDGEGPPRRAVFSRARHAVALDARTVLAVVEPGRVAISRDGGRTERTLAMPEGAAWSVGLDAVGAFVRGTRGDFRLEGEALVAAELPPAPTPAAVRRPMPPLPERADRIARFREGFAVVVGDRVEVRSTPTARATRRIPVPGADCAVFSSGGVLAASCVKEGWARALFALDPGGVTWRTLRDETRGEPSANPRFDPHTRAFAVQSPCAQRTTPDPSRLCFVDPAGQFREHALPFAASLLGVYDGVALAIDAAAPPRGPVRAARVTALGFTPFTIPYNRVTAQSALQHRDIVMLERDVEGGPVRAIARGEPARWSRTPAPPGSVDAVVTADGDVITLGDSAMSLARFSPTGARLSLPSPVQGDPRSLARVAAGGSYCVGPWCRLGAALFVDLSGASPGVAALGRDALPEALVPPVARRPLQVRCADEGRARPAPEIDRGAAIAGYAISAARAGDRVDVRWFGARLNRRASVRWPGPASEVFFALGAAGGARAGALLGRCTAGVCEHALVDGARVREAELPSGPPGASSLFDDGDAWIVRSDARLPEGRAVRLTVATRAAVARGDYALDPSLDAEVGTLGGARGLWVRSSPSHLRFYDLRGELRGEVTEERAGCARRDAPRGVIRRAERAAEVQGEGWRVEAGEWIVEETLHVYGDTACTAALAGGEPREEPPAGERPARETREVRTFALRAEGRDALVGTAWGGRRAYPQRCAVTP
ncbi:MAG: hypothetical protein R3A48_25065 [Polyangiales bacterium]